MDGMPMPLPITLTGAALVGAGISRSMAAHVGDEARVLQKGFGDELRPQRVAGHQHGLGKIAGVRRGCEG